MALADLVADYYIVAFPHVSRGYAGRVLHDGVPAGAGLHARQEVEGEGVAVGGDESRVGAAIGQVVQHRVGRRVGTRDDEQVRRLGEVQLVKVDGHRLAVGGPVGVFDDLVGGVVAVGTAVVIHAEHLAALQGGLARGHVHRGVGKSIDRGTVSIFLDADKHFGVAGDAEGVVVGGVGAGSGHGLLHQQMGHLVVAVPADRIGFRHGGEGCEAGVAAVADRVVRTYQGAGIGNILSHSYIYSIILVGEGIVAVAVVNAQRIDFRIGVGGVLVADRHARFGAVGAGGHPVAVLKSNGEREILVDRALRSEAQGHLLARADGVAGGEGDGR